MTFEEKKNQTLLKIINHSFIYPQLHLIFQCGENFGSLFCFSLTRQSLTSPLLAIWHSNSILISTCVCQLFTDPHYLWRGKMATAT